jgi:hypothetical protein
MRRVCHRHRVRRFPGRHLGRPDVHLGPSIGAEGPDHLLSLIEQGVEREQRLTQATRDRRREPSVQRRRQLGMLGLVAADA